MGSANASDKQKFMDNFAKQYRREKEALDPRFGSITIYCETNDPDSKLFVYAHTVISSKSVLFDSIE